MKYVKKDALLLCCYYVKNFLKNDFWIFRDYCNFENCRKNSEVFKPQLNTKKQIFL